MSRLTQQSSDDNRYILVAKLDNARNLLNVLKAVYFKEVRECCNRVDIDMPYIKPFESWKWLVCKFSSKFWISVEQIGNEKIWHYQPGNKVFLECINIKTKKCQVMVKTISSRIFLFFYPRPVSLRTLTITPLWLTHRFLEWKTNNATDSDSGHFFLTTWDNSQSYYLL